MRVPDHPTALALLQRTGPLAVSSANRTGGEAALTAQQARDQLGDSVAVYLDAGEVPGGVASTIVDATTENLRLIRAGAVSLEELRAVTFVLDVGEELPDSPDVSATDQAMTAGSPTSDSQELSDQ